MDIQGHRGCRGLFPENTVEGFIYALELGVNTLEMDVTISKDNKVIVSHDPFFSHQFCLKPDGSEITEEEEKNHRTFHMTAEEIKGYDTGSKYFEKFPDQKKMLSHKPTLEEVVVAVNTFVQENRMNVPFYNIEIKRKKEWDLEFHPEYKEFADLVIKAIEDFGIADQTTVQCFDVETLQYLHEKYPNHHLVYLINNLKSIESNLKTLGFNPKVYSPYYKRVNKKTIKYCNKENIKIIPWTVNEEEDMIKLINMDVDGIITDYPDRLINISKKNN